MPRRLKLLLLISTGASPHCLKIGEEAVPDYEMENEDLELPSSSTSTPGCTQNTPNMSNSNNPLEMSDDTIELMRIVSWFFIFTFHSSSLNRKQIVVCIGHTHYFWYDIF